MSDWQRESKGTHARDIDCAEPTQQSNNYSDAECNQPTVISAELSYIILLKHTEVADFAAASHPVEN